LLVTLSIFTQYVEQRSKLPRSDKRTTVYRWIETEQLDRDLDPNFVVARETPALSDYHFLANEVWAF